MTTFPFTAILGQEELKLALLLNAVDPQVGGLLALGDRGTAKSTTVRALGDLLALAGLRAPVVNLPLGATEDRVVGSIDIEAALLTGQRRFQPGLLAEADGGFLYIDEVNLLDDYLVDLLLDVAASGINQVEREGISHSHPARFVLVGSGNPEEGELRPQLEDRFGLAVFVQTLHDTAARVEIIRRRLAFQESPAAFCAACEGAQRELAARLAGARAAAPAIRLDEPLLQAIVRLCVAAGAVGHRAELVLARAARAHAALRGSDRVTPLDLERVALPALRHRIPREPFDTPDSLDERLQRSLREVLAG